MNILLNETPDLHKFDFDFVFGHIGNILWISSNETIWLFTNKYFIDNKTYKKNISENNLFDRILGEQDNSRYTIYKEFECLFKNRPFYKI